LSTPLLELLLPPELPLELAVASPDPPSAVPLEAPEPLPLLEAPEPLPLPPYVGWFP
jgi:hypothetical protein